jgi:hypothetical protein
LEEQAITSLTNMTGVKKRPIALDIADVVDLSQCYFLPQTRPCAVARWLCVCSRRGREVHSKFYSAIMNPLPQGSGFFSLAEIVPQFHADRYRRDEDEHEPAL